MKERMDADKCSAIAAQATVYVVVAIMLTIAVLMLGTVIGLWIKWFWLGWVLAMG